MAIKDLYIGDFNVKKCSQYGNFNVTSNLKAGDSLEISLDSNDVIVVKAKDTKGVMVEIGELDLPFSYRKIIVPLLKGAHGNGLFHCEVYSSMNNMPANGCFLITVWAL